MTTRQTITNHFALSKTRAWGAMDRQYITRELKDLQKGF